MTLYILFINVITPKMWPIGRVHWNVYENRLVAIKRQHGFAIAGRSHSKAARGQRGRVAECLNHSWIVENHQVRVTSNLSHLKITKSDQSRGIRYSNQLEITHCIVKVILLTVEAIRNLREVIMFLSLILIVTWKL